ncbi:hypothetical protein F4780DRAFT_275440 [Xylariomycetidae sp. FL0641]|nr:hypothetical protein F4780DRAFT_275440 [Xylariomycetidae sp. FL0641]
MKSFAVIPTMLLAASSAPVESRDATEMDITDFKAQTLSTGDGATISYDIAIPGVLSTHCEYADSTSTTKLPDISSLIPCDDAAITWEFRQDPSQPGTSGRYRIVVTYIDPSGKGVAGFHEWPSTDFAEETVESSTEVVYGGEADFVISDLS